MAGYGLREGVALNCVTDEVASVEQVQRVAVTALDDHFTAYDGSRADHRASLTRRLMAQLRPGVSDEVLLAATAAARLLDIGASIDHYRRHEHSARIVCDANLDGYSHRTLALIAAGIYAVGEREATRQELCAVAERGGSADCRTNRGRRRSGGCSGAVR